MVAPRGSPRTAAPAATARPRQPPWATLFLPAQPSAARFISWRAIRLFSPTRGRTRRSGPGHRARSLHLFHELRDPESHPTGARAARGPPFGRCRPRRRHRRHEANSTMEEITETPAPVAETLDLQRLKAKTMAELLALATELEIQSTSGLRKQELIFKVLEAQT